MKKYKVIKAFFKLSEKKNYAIDDIIELSAEDAKAMDWYVVDTTPKEKVNKLIAEVSKEDVKSILNKPQRKAP